jgi:hypothetical protein
LAVALGFIVLAACQMQGDIVQQEDTLTAAGFSVRIANTAASHLESLYCSRNRVHS